MLSFIPSQAESNPVDIANAALAEARKQFADVLIVDTAGRLHIDDQMMDEIKSTPQYVESLLRPCLLLIA